MAETLTETKEKTALSVPWNVIIHNDPINLMSYVTMVIKRVFGYSSDKAQKHMLEVHEKGKSVLTREGAEKAEFYVHELQKYTLHATLEREA